MKYRKTFLMTLILILYFSIIIPLLSASNSVAIKWYRTWGGISDDRDGGMVVDSSDNVYLSGWTYSFGAGSNDMILVKYGETEEPPVPKLDLLLFISVIGVITAITVISLNKKYKK